MARPYKGLRRKKHADKPVRNIRGWIPKEIMTGRKVKVPLVPRVENLIQGGIVPKPLWYEAVRAHPPSFENKVADIVKIQKFEWRDDDRLRRIWQNRNPEASMHPKVYSIRSCATGSSGGTGIIPK